ncbi:hypothetical protein ACIQPT_32895 [Streptomyces sp. NPDC091289]
MTALVSVIAVTVLALAGHGSTAAAVGAIGAGVSATGGIRVTVRIQR